jgi:hypothetical protein
MKRFNRALLATALFALASGVAFAEGDSGDNSMSPWTGESYAAFYGHNLGDFVTPRERLATQLTPAEEPSKEAVAKLDKRAHPLSPFRDDTA